MGAVDIAILILSIAITLALIFYFVYRHKSGKVETCDCGRKHPTGKGLVDEYRKAYPKKECDCAKK